MRKKNVPIAYQAQRFSLLVAVWMVATLLLGGASQGAAIANAVLQFGATAIIAVAIWGGFGPERQPGEGYLLTLFAALCLWIAIMFVPLPPRLWTNLPGRDFVANGYRLLDIELPWLSLALSPDRALRSAMALLVPLATYLFARRLDMAGRDRVVLFVLGAAAVSLFLGIAQMANGPDSGLRLHVPTNRDAPVGFFANTNHFSVFLVACLPLAATWVAGKGSHARSRKKYLAALALLFGLTTFGLALGRSLAGLGLLVPATISSIYLLFNAGLSRNLRLLLLAGSIVGGLVAATALAGIGTGAIGAKFDDAPNSRRQMTPVTMSAAMDMVPVGAGLGSFAQAYTVYQPDQLTNATWVNHAHNDLAELFLELGVPGLLMLAAFLSWFMIRGFFLWREQPEGGGGQAQAAWLAIAILLLHSLVDYPLRTAALASLFALLLALCIRPAVDDAAGHPQAQ